MSLVESINDALQGAINAMGGAKQVGPVLWPEMAPDKAQRKLLDCLNDNRHERLSPDQVVLVLRLARRGGHHEAVGWLLHELGYAPTRPVDHSDEAAELQRKFIEATGKLQEMAAQIQSLQLEQQFKGWADGRQVLRAAA